VTSILIVFEMTHDFAVFPVLRADGTLEGVVSRLALQHFVE
jgi:H+/Cl- antiporter ClcA